MTRHAVRCCSAAIRIHSCLFVLTALGGVVYHLRGALLPFPSKFRDAVAHLALTSHTETNSIAEPRMIGGMSPVFGFLLVNFRLV